MARTNKVPRASGAASGFPAIAVIYHVVYAIVLLVTNESVSECVAGQWRVRDDRSLPLTRTVAATQPG